MKSRFTLVPSELFTPESAADILSKVVPLTDGEPLSFLELPSRDAVFVYAGNGRPIIYDMVVSLFKIREYNKIIACHRDGELSLVVAQGEQLQFCNVFQAADFVTAQYYIFLTLKTLQLNPQLSTIYFVDNLSHEQSVSLYNYFKKVELMR